jgi:hypothetical protein
MSRTILKRLAVTFLASCLSWTALAQAPQEQSSSSAKHKHSSVTTTTELDNGAVETGTYRNKALGLSCRIPPGWVQRTDEMNAPEEGESQPPNPGSLVLLAVFSRPPAARGEDVNDSIVIAAEPLSSYPGLKEPAQYFEPLSEVAKSQGFVADEEPYEVSIGTKSLVRGDFHKNIGSRVMRQSTLVFLARDRVISITAIAGTTDELEDLLDGLDFPASSRRTAPAH